MESKIKFTRSWALQTVSFCNRTKRLPWCWGSINNGAQNDFFKYNTTINQWSLLGIYTGQGTNGFANFSINNFGYVGLGASSTSNYYFSDINLYDTVANNWTVKDSFPAIKRYRPSSTSLNNKGYIGLGVTFNPNNFFNDFWEYTPDSTTSINEVNELNLSVEIFPNPFIIALNISTKSNETFEIILYNLSSKILLQQKFTSSVSLNTVQFAKGIYIYEVRSKNGVIKKGKVVKE